MAIVYFGKTVKYKGTTYLPNTKFEAEDSDIDSLKQQGAWVIEQDEPKLKKEVEEQKVEKREIDILRDKALDLGIDFKGNWGVKKLKEAIAEAESQ